MNRALLLVLTVGLAAAGLSYVLLSSPGATLPADTPEEPTAGLARKGADLPVKARPKMDTLEAVPDREPPVVTEGTLAAWEIVPMNAKGQAQTNATITATYRDGTELTGTGQTTFNGVPYGEWTVVVTQEGEPEWRREMTIDSRTKRRMYVYVGEEQRIAGEVVDTYGAPVGDVHVLFLSPGMSHPTTADIKATGGLDRIEGVTHAKTTKTTGKFRMRLPEPGRYRVSVGAPGKARWTLREPVEVTSGGFDFARIVIPATSSLAMSFPDPTTRPTQVGAYVFDADRAARHAAQQAERGSNRITDVGAAREELLESAKNEELARAKAEGRSPRPLEGGNIPLPLKEQNRRTFERNMDEYGTDDGDRDGKRTGRREPVRAPLFEPGWRSVRTSYPDANGQVLLRDLPEREGLRFLFVRGRERIVTPTQLTIASGRRNIAEVTLPDLSNEQGTIVQSQNAMVRVSEDRDAAEQMIEAGVTWSYDRR